MSTDAKAPRAASGRGRLMATLFAAQVCGSTGHSIGMAVGRIMAAGITGLTPGPACRSPSARSARRSRAGMGLMGAFGFAAGGMILGVWGFTVLNTLGAVLVLGPLAATLLRRPARASLSTPRG